LALPILLCVACNPAPAPTGGVSLPPSVAPAPSSAAPAPPSAAPAPTATASAPLTLIVAGDSGVLEVGLDGAVKRTLARSPARRPRLTAGGKEVLFFARDLAEIRRITLATGAVARVAALPRSFAICAGGGRKNVAIGDLDVQDPDDFVVDGGALCMSLMDRNANMANVRVHVRVDLASGAVQHRVSAGGACDPKAPDLPACAPPPEPPPAAAAAPFPLSSLGLPATVKEESVSPSGRWSVLSQETEGGDYIHRSLLLLDRRERRVYTLAKGPFPSPLASAQLASPQTITGTADAVGESDVRWIGGRDLLLVDRLLVTPEQGGVELPGDVAR
jgi:hypothetical protein